MTEPRNPPAYAELLEWMEEAVEYVNKGSRSPSLEEEGRRLLRLAKPAPAAQECSCGVVCRVGRKDGTSCRLMNMALRGEE